MLDKLIIFLIKAVEGLFIAFEDFVWIIGMLLLLPLIWNIMVLFPTFSTVVFILLFGYGAYSQQEFIESMFNRYIHKDDDKFK